MPFVSTPRLRVHYEEAGAGPEVFVFVHGNFASWRWWKPVLDKLPAGWRGIAPDLRGCGETGDAPDATRAPFAIPELSADLGSFVDALDLGVVHLVGHSLGGAVALQYALQHQARVRSLTLVAPAPPTGLSALREGTSTAALVPRAGLDKMAQMLPAAELVVWPDTGHSPQLERPDEFIALLASSRRGLLARRLRMLLGRAKRWYGAAL